jgi:hypothetical protein
MNYSALYPEVLNNFKKLQLKPESMQTPQFTQFYNQDVSKSCCNIFVPYGKKCCIWFCCIYNKSYCFILDLQQHHTKRVQFIYASFSDILTKGKGTVLYGTIIGSEFCCERVLYFSGKAIHTDNIIEHMDMACNIITNYTKQISFTYREDIQYNTNYSLVVERSIAHTLTNPSKMYKMDFLSICIPHMTTEKNDVLSATNLHYRVHKIIRPNNFVVMLNHYTAFFCIEKSDNCNDTYNLKICYKKKSDFKNEQIQCVYYDTAFVNDYKTTQLLASKFNNEYINFEDIELSDDDDDDNDEDEEHIEKHKRRIYFACVYIPDIRKWKPYYEISERRFFESKSQCYSQETRIKSIERKFATDNRDTRNMFDHKKKHSRQNSSQHHHMNKYHKQQVYLTKKNKIYTSCIQ